MHFGENQLSRSLIGLSPLPTTHPLHFQLKWVRASTASYCGFTLAMGRSLRFGSRTRDSIALFRLAFATASPHGLTSPRIANSQAHSSKGTLSPLLRRLQRFVSKRFQVLFHSPPGVLFTFPSRYLSAIGHQEVFRLTGWSRQIHSRFHEPAATRGHAQTRHNIFSYRTLTVYGRPFQATSPNIVFSYWPSGPADPDKYDPTTPHTQPLPGITCAWFSLIRFRSPLLTESHVVFSSCGY